MTARLPFAAAALFLLNTAQAFGQAGEHAGPASHTLEFIENKGQWDGRSRYEAQLPGGRLFAETDGLTFSLLADGGPARHAHGAPAKAAAAPADSTVRGHALKLRFAGAAPATITAATPTTEHRNYFLGGDSRRWAHDVRSFRELRYAGLWPGVSARVYESADQRLEYDFVLAPGAQAGAIALRHDGADGLGLDAAGNLLVKTSVGTLTERAPQAWQADAAGRRQPVACRYVLTGSTVHFALGKYDATRPLTIDPVVVFSTYTGATADNWGFTATYDAQGNLYSGGIVFGQGYPTSLGAYRTLFSGLFDIGIIKYNTNVTGAAARVWATYLGGTGADFPHSLVVNSLGELLILGTTGSTGAAGSATAFPTTTGALQRTFAGGSSTAPFGFSYAPYNVPTGSDLIITRLNATGTALLGSTYLGGSGNDGLLPLDPNISPFDPSPQLAHNYGDPFRSDIQVDAADNVYIATHTTSTNFPMARGFNSTYRGGTSDGVVCKLNPGLTALTWGSYLGGTGSDGAFSIQIEPTSGDVYVAGGTLSPNFPTTAGAYRTTRPGDVDGFVTRIAANGTSILRSSFVGTDEYDQAFFLQLGTDGGVYLLGQTGGAFPVTPGLYNTRFGTQFIQKLDANLGQSLLSTVFGSTNAANIGFINIDPTAFLVDQCDRVYVCGWGGNENAQGYPYMAYNGTTVGMPTTPGAAQTTTDGSDFYLAQFSAGLTSLAYATYYGDTTPNSAGEHVDGGTSRFDPRGIVYQAVCSCFTANGFPIPPGANYYSTTNNSVSNTTFNVSCNNASFVLNFQPAIANAGSDQGVCATAGPLALVGSPAGGVWSGPGVTGSVTAGFVFTPSVALVGVQTLTYTVASTGACTTTGVRRVTVTTPPAVTFSPLPQATYCLPAPGAPPYALVPLTGSPAGGTFSGTGVTGSVAAGFSFSPNINPGTYPLTYSVNVNGCVATATQTVSIVSASNAGVAQTVCASAAPLTLVGQPGGGTWSGPGVTGSAAAGFVFTPSAALVGVNTLTYTLGGSCSSNRLVTVTSPPTVVFNPLPQASYCLPAFGGSPLPAVSLTGTPAGGTFSGPGVSGSSGTGFAFSPTLVAGTYQLTYTVVANGCTVQATQAVTLVNAPAPTLPADTVLCPGSSQAFRLRGTPVGGTFSGTGVTGNVATGFVFTPPASFPGAITVTYSLGNSAGCTGSATRRISVAAVPQLAPTWTPVACTETRLAPLTLRFTLAGSGIPTPPNVVWDFGDGTQSTEASPTHTYAAVGSYRPTLRVRYNADRCEIQTALPVVEVLERKIPNIITPNGDTQNQFFRLGPDCPPRLQIFSRWGQQVLDAPAYRDDWKAEGQPDGVYYYLLTYPDGHRLKGWVEVVR
ncbi:gliding motility-associated C-terminal domain-containing protein [Hymenobacter sp. M29]|uniref:Gliding motility-associated C-terminal domain-containing protein n=1 Tax=Hymenobacter mellowenesis TaxID=3063995 RepID=A0ABT9ADB0_9BACT|nr:gliding motility-associated C-terminal domain-containing protein [Hymenobacter sp. M29]MDO7847845.1 gliding motility-associated C-terminal domain-containing protein [Hymenobacter sp. M29]